MESRCAIRLTLYPAVRHRHQDAFAREILCDIVCRMADRVAAIQVAVRLKPVALPPGGDQHPEDERADLVPWRCTEKSLIYDGMRLPDNTRPYSAMAHSFGMRTHAQCIEP